jgi:hypothetical protein
MLAMLVAIGSFVLGLIGTSLCLLAIRRRVHLDLLQPNNEVVALYLSIVTALYGLFFGFVIVSLWEQQRDAEDNIIAEAKELRTVFRLADGLAEPGRSEIRALAMAYAHEVIDSEWPKLIAGDEKLSSHHPAKSRLWARIIAHEPDTEREHTFYGSLVEHFENLSDARNQRCYDALRTLPDYLWLILVMGSALSIACTFFLGTSNLRTQLLLSGVSGGLIVLMLFVVYDLQRPFRGYWVASPMAFELAVERMDLATRDAGIHP